MAMEAVESTFCQQTSIKVSQAAPTYNVIEVPVQPSLIPFPWILCHACTNECSMSPYADFAPLN
jgi:hypothetical protein